MGLEEKFDEKYDAIKESIEHNKKMAIKGIKDENVEEASRYIHELKKNLNQHRLLREIRESFDTS